MWEMRSWPVAQNQNGDQKDPLKCAVSHLCCITGLLATKKFDSIVPRMVGVCGELQAVLPSVVPLINHPLFNSIHPRKLSNEVDLGSGFVGCQD